MRDPASTTSEQTVVIGAGQAGFSFCAKLRELGYLGKLSLIGDEPHAPYQRPPLSKAYLLGEMSLDRLLLRPAEFFNDQNIELITGTVAAAIDRAARTVSLDDGSSVSFDRLVLATGSAPRKLPARLAGDLGGIYYMRSVADADSISPEFAPGRRVLVVGGGYIGLEAAAVAAKRGLKVTLVEAADRILQRVASTQTSDYFRQLHQSHGVDIREGIGLEALHGHNGRVSSASLSDGSSLNVDFVIVGIGIVPNDQLAADADIQCDNGVCVDDRCRSSDPAIMAVGDCARFPYNGTPLRLESVSNAIDQAQAAAAVIMGSDEPYTALPWFWSDQYDTKLQIAGLSSGFDSVVIRSDGSDSCSHWYYREDQLLAVDAMNDPRAYMVAKRLIQAGKSPPAQAVVDSGIDLKQLLKP